MLLRICENRNSNMSQRRKQKMLVEARKNRQRRTIATIAIVTVLILIIAVAIYFATKPTHTILEWPYPCLGQESLTFHIHPWLRIWIDNTNVTIPAAVGITNPVFSNGIAGGGSNSCFEPMHTHDNSGIIHIESPDNSTQYTLANFFKIWKISYGTVTVNGASQPIEFNQTDILGFRTDTSHTLTVLVDGHSDIRYDSLSLNQYDYCDSTVANVPPCYPTAAGGPYPPSYPYGTEHTIIIEYKSGTA